MGVRASFSRRCLRPGCPRWLGVRAGQRKLYDRAAAGRGDGAEDRHQAPRPRTAARVVRPAVTVTRLRVYPTTPLATPSTALYVDKVASSINFVDAGQISRTGSLNITDALQQRCRASMSARCPAIRFSRTWNFAASSPRRCRARRRGWRCIRTACASTKPSATPSTGI